MNQSDDELLIKPIIVLGAPRSGTSFLANIIEQHRTLAIAREPRFTWKYGNDHKSDMLRPVDARPEVTAHIRKSFARRVREAGRQRLLEKTPSNSLRPGFIDCIFPDCRFVHITRSGVDSIFSMRRMWSDGARGINPQGDAKQPVPLGQSRLLDRLREIKLRQWPYYSMELIRRVAPLRLLTPAVLGPRLPGIEAMRREMDLLELCFWQWQACVEQACHYGRRLPPSRYMQFRFEDLSFEMVKSVLAFCELDEDPAVLEYFGGRFDPAQAGKATTDADPEELARVRDWIEPTTQWLEGL